MIEIWHDKKETPQKRGKQILIRFQDNCWDTVKVTRNMQEDWDDYYETAWLEWAYLDDILYYTKGVEK